MANLKYNQRKYWKSFHEVKRDLDVMIKATNDRRGSGSRIDRYIDANLKIAEALDLAISSKRSIRFLGGRWSMSAIAHEQDSLLDTQSLNIKIPITQNDIDANSQEDPDKLFLFQCGNAIKEINNYLRKRNLSLSTSGASNGQTIAGAMSTGTHGAAMNFGCVQDFVVGLHVIINGSKNYIIERASSPVVSSSFAGSLNAELVRDDKLFNAALVSMGSFGFIAGVIVKTESIYLLDNYVFDLSVSEVEKVLTKKEFNHPSVATQTGYSRNPDHFKLFINPFDPGDKIRLEVMYKEDNISPTRIPQGETSTHTYHKDVLSVIKVLADRSKWIVPTLLKLLKSTVLPKIVKRDIGTLGQHFSDTTTGGKTFSCAMGISIDQIWEALNVLIKMFKDFGPIPAIISIRIVKGTDALLGWTKFPLTCVLEIDGVQAKRSYALVKNIPAIFDAKSIDYTFHWGKMNPLDKTLVKKIYGNNYEEWISQRSRLMTEEEGMIFSSDYSIDLGLGEYKVNQTIIDVVA